MIVTKCIKAFKSKDNKSQFLRLQDSQGNIQDIEKDKLKVLIVQGQISVLNLTLTSDNRLIKSDKAKIMEELKSLANELSQTQAFIRTLHAEMERTQYNYLHTNEYGLQEELDYYKDQMDKASKKANRLKARYNKLYSKLSIA